MKNLFCMKKSIAFIICLVMIISLAACAFASNADATITGTLTSTSVYSTAMAATIEGTVPTVYGIDDDIKNEWEKQSKGHNLINDLSPITKSKADILQSNEVPDILCIITRTEPIIDLIRADLIALISPTQTLSEDLGAMPNIVKQAFTDNFISESKYYGFPYNIDITPLGFWVPETWENSPFSKIDPPSSFTELLDFLDLYLCTPHEGYCFIYDSIDRWPDSAIDLLMDCWIIQCRAEGKALTFFDSQFISLAERTRELANKLCSLESNAKRKKQHQLLTTHFYGYTENGMDTFTWDNLIPWRITSDQTPYVHINFSLYCFSKNSAFVSVGAHYLESILSYRSIPYYGQTDWMRYLYCHPDQINVQSYNNQVLSRYGSKWKCMFMTQDFLDSIYRIDQYAIPCIVDRTEYQYYKTELCSKAAKTIKDFKTGRIDGAEFASQLDELNK